MICVVQPLGATASNGALSLWVQSADGILTDVSEAFFQIFDSDDVQVFPFTLDDREELDVEADRLGLGHYAATWEAMTEGTPLIEGEGEEEDTPAVPPAAMDPGQYTIRWFYTVEEGGDEKTFDQEFELVDKAYKGPHYCTIYDLREEGISDSVTDIAAQKLITLASRYVEHFTGRKFAPEYKTVRLDGTSARALLLDEPVIAVEEVLVAYASEFSASDLAVETDTLKIYNRHLTEELTAPDDRDNPKLEFVHGDDLVGVNVAGNRWGLIWPRGRKNVQIKGLFGYTEPDGSWVGQTPELIREACKLLAFQNNVSLVSSSSAPDSSRIIMEKTRDQEVHYSENANGSAVGQITGDWSVDSILAAFVRPPRFGAA